MTPNQRAFLATIRWSEIGPGLLKVSDDGYNVLVGSTQWKPLLFDSYRQHPNILNPVFNSTAAGAYQILYRYWKHYKAALGLRDFGKESQDAIALQLISECGALTDIEAGRIQIALSKCRSRWASLPGAGYKLPNGKPQPENKVHDLVAAYERALQEYTA